MHGLALNVNTDLNFFSHIVPCGIADRNVTSLSQEVGRRIPDEDAADRLVTRFSEQFHTNIRRLDGEAANTFIQEFSRKADVAEQRE